MCKSVRVFITLLVFLATFSTWMWADQGGSVQVGYAIITPTGTNTSGLVVFETFGEIHDNKASQAGVLPANMTTDALIFVSSDGRLSRNLGVAIANPGSKDATLTLVLHRADGSVLATKTIVVKKGQQVARFVTELFADQPEVAMGFMGLLEITSDNPVAIIGLRFRGENFSTLPVTSLSPPTPVPLVAPGVGGPNAVILPQFAAGGGWASEIIIGNSGTKDLIVRVDVFGRDGNPLVVSLNGQTASSFVNLTVPAGGVIRLAVLDDHGEDDF